MSASLENEYGLIEVIDVVIANIAGYAATRCYGVVGMTQKGRTDGLANLLKKETMSKGIKITKTAEGFYIDLHIMVEYGVNISALCDNIVSTVKYILEDQIGIKVKDVTVFVDGIRVD